MFRLLVLLVILLLPSLAHAQGASARRYFGDWLAVCQPDGYCSAVAYVNPNPGDGRVADHWFRIGRHAEESYWELSFTPIKVMADPAASFTIRVDGEEESFEGSTEIAPYGAVNDFFLLGKKAQAVMDRLMPGRRLDVTFTDEAGASTTAEFSLDGLTAALIWIDDRQNRIGSERVAEIPPVGLAPAFEPSLPPAIDVTTMRLVNLHNASSNCSLPIDEETYQRLSRVSIDDTYSLFLVPCEDFAYNFISAAYLATPDTLAPAVLPESDAATGNLGNTIYAPQWDEASAMLSSSYKGGNGNCGSQGRWLWVSDHFELVDLRARETCDDSSDPWPIIRGTGAKPAAP